MTYKVGDNAILLKELDSESIDMIYMDPPYNTGRNFYYFQDKFSDFSSFMEVRIKRVSPRDEIECKHCDTR